MATSSYESLSHSRWDCKYHVVFIPKCRKKAIYGEIREFLRHTFRELAEQKGMSNILFGATDKWLLKKRGVTELVNDILKSLCYIEHSRHRSPVNFLVNLIAGLIAYSFREKKPSIKRKPQLDQRIGCTV